jgi:hypothetical protein
MFWFSAIYCCLFSVKLPVVSSVMAGLDPRLSGNPRTLA